MTVTTSGKAAVAALIAGTPSAEFGSFVFIAIGSGTVAPAAGDTALGGEFVDTDDTGAIRVADATPTRSTTNVTNDTAQIAVTYAFTQTLGVTESGLFNGSPQGVGSMLARQKFSTINVVNGDSLTVTWKITAS